MPSRSKLKMRICFYLLIIFESIQLLSAQTNKLRFEEIYTKDRYTKSSIYAIYQDSEDFLWFGSQEGLFRYNGYELKIYKNDPFNPSTLSDNWIQAITEDNDGNLWLGSYSSGAFKFERSTGKFYNYNIDENDSNSISGNSIWTIFVDQKNRIWFGTSNGLSLFNPATNNFKNYYPTGAPSRQDAVNSIAEDKDGNLYVGTWGKGLFKFSTKQLTFEPLLKNADYQLTKIKKILLQNESVLWVATFGGGLLKYNIYDKNYKVFLHNNNDKFSLSENLLQSLTLADDNHLWVGTRATGLSILDIKAEKFQNYRTNKNDEKSLSDNWIGSLYKDKSGIIWIGSGLEIQKFIPRNQNFHVISLRESESELSAVSVNSITEDLNGNIWVGTYGAGLRKYNAEKQLVKVFKTSNSNLQSDIVWKVIVDSNGDIWAGTDIGFYKLNKSGTNFLLFTSRNSDLSHNNVSALFEDSRGNFWVGTWRGGLNLFDRNENKFTVFRSDNKDSTSISDDIISSIFEDSKNNLWIGTNGGGLNLFDYETNSFTSFKYQPEDLTSLSNNFVKTIAEDSNGNLWVGTSGGGISKFNSETRTFSHFTEEDGLSSNIVLGIIPYQNELWISTNSGLSRFNLETKKFILYDAQDGLANTEFYNGYYKSKLGILYFGSIEGLTYFDPLKIGVSNFNPPIKISSFKIFNKKVPFHEDAKEPIKINYDENFFTIEFAALDYSRPDKIHYAYMVDGFNKDWVEVEHRRSATYTNLDPGKYTFIVKATNSDGLWGDNLTSVELYILPPFWKTLWFRLLIIMIVLLSFATFYFVKVRGVRIRNEMLESEVAKRTRELKEINSNLQREITVRVKAEEQLIKSEHRLKQINADKDKFFSIIAHDLKSPFTSLLGYASFLDSDIENLSKEDIRSFAKDISNASTKLFNLLENLLNWSTVQLGRLTPNPKKLGLKELAQNIITVLIGKANNKQITIENNLSEDCIAYADEQMVTSTFQNLISNSIKFTNDGGEITLSCSYSEKEIEIRVKDNGIGIEQEDLEKLFKIDERSTRIGKTNKNKGTGLGLILCKEFIELNGGKISVDSELGKGTTFFFTLPKYVEKKVLTN